METAHLSLVFAVSVGARHGWAGSAWSFCPFQSFWTHFPLHLLPGPHGPGKDQVQFIVPFLLAAHMGMAQFPEKFPTLETWAATRLSNVFAPSGHNLVAQVPRGSAGNRSLVYWLPSVCLRQNNFWESLRSTQDTESPDNICQLWTLHLSAQWNKWLSQQTKLTNKEVPCRLPVRGSLGLFCSIPGYPAPHHSPPLEKKKK